MTKSDDSRTAVRPPGPAVAEPPVEPGQGRALGLFATACVIGSLVIFIGASLIRPGWFPPYLPMPRFGPPWQLSVHVPVRAVIGVLWFGGALGSAGVIAGLIALRRGDPLPVRVLVVAGLLGVAILTVLPPVGSSDALDYAVYGHIAELGHSPYVMTPLEYKVQYNVSGQGVPSGWDTDPSVYGPLATFEQLIAAKLGGASLARAVFWLKLVNAAVFAAVALAAVRLLRDDRRATIRAHLLWTANPLLIWAVIASGHVDLLAAGIGLAGLLLLDRWHSGDPLLRALAAGLCTGAAADIKADFLLFILAVAWALRRSPRQLLAAGAGALIVLLPSYAVTGIVSIKALTSRAADATGYGFYGFYGPFLHHLGFSLADSVWVAACLVIPVGWLALTRLPFELHDNSAIRAALALSLTWLLLWPDQFAWYSVMIICVLVFYPATRLDWLAVAWLAAMTIADMPGRGVSKLGYVPRELQVQFVQQMAPLVMLVAAIALVAMCINGRWRAPALPGALAAAWC